jgi:hypothetical protein
MAAVIGYLVIAGIAIAADLLVAGLHHVGKRDATLALTLVAFFGGVAAFVAMTLLPIAARREGWASMLPTGVTRRSSPTRRASRCTSVSCCWRCWAWHEAGGSVRSASPQGAGRDERRASAPTIPTPRKTTISPA